MPRSRTNPTSEPSIPPQPLPEPLLPLGQRAIPLHRKIGGSNRHAESLRFAVVAYTVVDQADYDLHAKFLWSARWDEGLRSYFAARKEKSRGKTLHILLAREIIGLPRHPGRGSSEQADHIDNNPLNNRRSNLRVVNHAENQANRRRHRNATHRFRGVYPRGSRYQAQFCHNGYNMHTLPSVPLEAEAAFMFNHVVSLLRDPHAQRNDIPVGELPSVSRQAELTALVESKLRQAGLLT